MKVGLSSYTYTWEVGVPGREPVRPLDALALVQRALAERVPVVQFADNMPLHDLPSSVIETIAETANSNGIALEVGTRGIGAHISRYVELAGILGSPFVRIVVDSAGDHPSVEEACERLGGFESEFRDAGCMLAIENHDRFRTSELITLVTGLGEWAGICLDTVNSFGALEAPETVVQALGPHAINLHLKDFTIRRHGHQMGFEIEGTPAGSGLLDVEWLLAALSGNTRIESAILELWTPPEATLEATIAKESAWASQSLDFLRTCPGLEFR